jgi:hypothetical protein
MNEYLERQKSILRQLIGEYRAGRLTLDTLVQRIEGVSQAIGIERWKKEVFPIVLVLEQVNAASLGRKTGLTDADKTEVANSLRELEMLIECFHGP